jgi:hypothetical protein
MFCEHVREHLSAYLDKELTAEVTAAVQDHLDTCAECRMLLEELRATTDLLGRLPVHAAPDRTAQDVQREIERRAILAGAPPAEEAPGERTVPIERARVWARALAVAATVALAAGIGLLAYLTSLHRPPAPTEVAVPLLRDEIRLADARAKRPVPPAAAQDADADRGGTLYGGWGERQAETAIANGRLRRLSEPFATERENIDEGLLKPPLATAAKPKAPGIKTTPSRPGVTEMAGAIGAPPRAKDTADNLKVPAKPDLQVAAGKPIGLGAAPAPRKSEPLYAGRGDGPKSREAEPAATTAPTQIAAAPLEKALEKIEVARESAPGAEAPSAESLEFRRSTGAPAARPAAPPPGPAPAAKHAVDKPASVLSERPAAPPPGPAPEIAQDAEQPSPAPTRKAGLDIAQKHLGPPGAGKPATVPTEAPAKPRLGAGSGMAVAKAPAPGAPPALGAAVRTVTTAGGPAAVQQVMISVSNGMAPLDDLQAVVSRENLKQAEYQLVLVADPPRRGKQALQQLFRSNGWEAVAQRAAAGKAGVATDRAAGATGGAWAAPEDRKADASPPPAGFYYSPAPTGGEDTWVVVTDLDRLSRFASELGQVDALMVSADSSGVFRPIATIQQENLRRRAAGEEGGKSKAAPEPAQAQAAKSADLDDYKLAKPRSTAPSGEDGVDALGETKGRAHRGKLAPADTPTTPGQPAGRGHARTDADASAGPAAAPSAPKAPPRELLEKEYKRGVGQEHGEQFGYGDLHLKDGRATGNQVLVVIRVRPAEAKQAAEEAKPPAGDK